VTISFITGFRNRDTDRVKKSLDSLQMQSCLDFELIFIDYGSAAESRAQIQEVISSYNFCKYFYSDTRGWLWNRSAALNTGAKLSESEHLFFTDIDIVYDINFVENAYALLQEDAFFVSDCVRMPDEFTDWPGAITGTYKNKFPSMMGQGIACYPRKAFIEMGGFDEQYAYWGAEDFDLARRMKYYGFQAKNAEALYSYHQWHPKSSVDIPYSLLFHNSTHYFNNIRQQKNYANEGMEWGKLHTIETRPTSKYIDFENSLIINPASIRFQDAYNISGIYKWLKDAENSTDILWGFSKSRNNNKFTAIMNKFLRRIDLRIEQSATYLEDFSQGLLVSVPGFFKDYYLGCHDGKLGRKYSVFMT